MRIIKDQSTDENTESFLNLWSVSVTCGKHPNYPQPAYAVTFKTHLVGGAGKSLLVNELSKNFYDNLETLNVFGPMNRAELHHAITHVDNLIRSGEFRRVPNLLGAMNDPEGVERSQALYEQVLDAVRNDLGAYPTISSNAYRAGVSSGVIVDTEKPVRKYGGQTIAVTTDALMKILGFGRRAATTAPVMEITRAWLEHGFLLKLNTGKRRQDEIRPRSSSNDGSRFYILWLAGELAHD